MPRQAQTSADEFIRFSYPIYFEGYCFFDTKENCKNAAKLVRDSFKIKCRSIVIPDSGGMFGYFDRFVLMLPQDLDNDTYIKVGAFLHKQKGFEGH